MNRPKSVRSRRHPDGKGRARNRSGVVRRPAKTRAPALPPATARVVDTPPHLEAAPPGERAAGVEGAPPEARPWWYARAMYGLVVMVGLGAVLVWVSTGGILAIAATVMAVATAIPALSLARGAPREPRKRD